MRKIFIIICLFVMNLSIFGLNSEDSLKNAEELYNTGNYIEALNQLNEFLTIEPTNLRGLQDRSAILYALNDYQNALDDINIVMKFNPKSLKARHFRASIYEAMKLFEEALTDELVVLNNVPDYLPGLNLAGYICLELKRYNESLDYFNKLIFYASKTNKETDIYYLNRAYLFYNLGEFDSALADLSLSLNINYKNVDALVLRTLIYRENKDYMNAMNTITNAINISPDENELVYIRVILNLEVKNIPDVKSDLDKLENRGANSAEYHALLGAYYTIQGDISSAKIEVEQYNHLEKECKNPLLIRLFTEEYFE